MKCIFSTLLSFVLLFSISAQAFADGEQFKDVSSTAYYAEAVDWAAKREIVTGTSPTAFSPNKECTQGEIITFLYRAVGSPPTAGENPYSDENVSTEQYYYLPMLWAYKNEIVFDTDLNPKRSCTRADTMLYIWRYCGSPIVTTSYQFIDLPTASDLTEVPEITAAASWAIEESITAGTSSSTFSPEKICTRAEVVTFLYRTLSEQGTGHEPDIYDTSDIDNNEQEVNFEDLDAIIALGKKVNISFDASCNIDSVRRPFFADIISSDESIKIIEKEMACDITGNTIKIAGHAKICGNLLGSATLSLNVGDKALISKFLTVESDMPAILANGKEITDDNIQEILYGLRSQYPEGSPWGWESTYRPPYSNLTYGACEAFSRLCSDAVFGNLPVSAVHSDFDRIRAGDRITYLTEYGILHAVTVIEKKDNSVVVVEGNYGGTVHYGGKISRQELDTTYFTVESRYTVKN